MSEVRAWNIQRALGGESVSDALGRVFASTPLKPLIDKLVTNGSNGESRPPTPPAA